MNNNSKDKHITHLATKMAVVKTTIDNDLIYISNTMNSMELDELFIVEINVRNSVECNIFELEHRSRIKYIKVGLEIFIENFLGSSSQIDFWNINKNTLYILKDGNYSDIKELFTVIQDTKVKLVRGSSQKAHIISPIDFRLSCYLLILCKMNYKKFYFHNSFNELTKDRYLPSSKI